jgi:hypothetical protein
VTENQPHDPEVDDLDLTSEDWDDLRIAYNFGTYEPAPGTVGAEAFRRMGEYARSEAERVAAEAEEAEEAWRASRHDCQSDAGLEPEAGQ